MIEIIFYEPVLLSHVYQRHLNVIRGLTGLLRGIDNYEAEIKTPGINKGLG